MCVQGGSSSLCLEEGRLVTLAEEALIPPPPPPPRLPSSSYRGPRPCPAGLLPLALAANAGLHAYLLLS